MIKLNYGESTLGKAVVKLVTKRSNRVIDQLEFIVGTDARLVVEVTEIPPQTKKARNVLVDDDEILKRNGKLIERKLKGESHGK